MNIETAEQFVGPNIFSDQPLMHFRIAELKRRGTTEIQGGGRDILLRLLPGLAELSGSCEASTFFASTEDGARLATGHAIEHVAIALQNQAGSELVCARNEAGQRIRSRSVLIAYEVVEICEAAVALAAELVTRLASDRAANHDSIEGEFSHRIESFLSLANRRMLPVQDRSFVRAARARDVPVHRVVARMIQLGQGYRQKRVSATKTTLTNVVSNDIAANKDFSRRILSGLELPVPRYERVYRSQDAVDAAKRIGLPVVVKPNQGNMGQAVSVGMRTLREVRAAYKRAREIGRSVLVEEQVEGDDFRVLVINGQYCAASKRTPGHVVGDGTSTIEELLVILNADPRRGSGPRSPWTRLEIDEQAERLLEDRGMSRTSIPDEGDIVYLRRNANTSDGGTAIDVTDEVHPDNRRIAVRAARAIGLDIAGVDFLTTDIGRSMWKTGGMICEINSRPGLRKHMWPANGPARDIMTPIVDMLYPDGEPSRIPVVALLGIDKQTNRRLARRLSHLLESSGRRTGLLLNHRVYINGRKTHGAQMTAPAATQRILFDPDVEVAVLEMTVNDVFRNGLGCDAFDLSFIMPNETSLSARSLAAIRVVAGATRNEVMIDDNEALREAVADHARDAKTLTLKRNEIETAPTDGESEDEIQERMAREFVNDVASQVAARLGLSRREIRRGIRSYKSRSGKPKTRVEKDAAE